MDHESRDRRFQLSFRSLVDGGPGCTFPCDAAGQVDIDALGEQARNAYLYARALIGREFSRPTVEARAAG